MISNTDEILFSFTSVDPVEKNEDPDSKKISYKCKNSRRMIEVLYNPDENQNIYTATILVFDGSYVEIKILDNAQKWFELLQQSWSIQHKSSQQH